MYVVFMHVHIKVTIKVHEAVYILYDFYRIFKMLMEI